MTTTTKMGNGLAVSPEEDLALFAEMARQGKHLCGTAKLGHGWSFTDGPAEDATFDLAYESSPGSDYFDIFRAAGWSHVLSFDGTHIFKAAAGTPPVHTSAESRREELVRRRDRYFVHSLIALAALIVGSMVLTSVSWGVLVETALLVALIFPAVYTVIPLLGYARQLRGLDGARRVRH